MGVETGLRMEERVEMGIADGTTRAGLDQTALQIRRRLVAGDVEMKTPEDASGAGALVPERCLKIRSIFEQLYAKTAGSPCPLHSILEASCLGGAKPLAENPGTGFSPALFRAFARSGVLVQSTPLR